MPTSPTALLIDSDCGWDNTGIPWVNIFKSPSFSISSRNGVIYFRSPDSEKKYKGNPIEELEKYLDKGFISVGVVPHNSAANIKVSSFGPLEVIPFFKKCFFDLFKTEFRVSF